MHIDVLVEDSSGHRLLEIIIPRIIGEFGEPHTWKIISYKGIGRIPKDLRPATDASKRILLDRLPDLLRGYGRTPGIDGLIVVVDSDRRSCVDLLSELKAVAAACNPSPNVMFRIAIEEIESWYLGDRSALLSAYPRARLEILNRYEQDSVCDTWELLADAVHKGGSAALKRQGYAVAGSAKHEWAAQIGSKMDVANNNSPSFIKFRDGLIRMVSSPLPDTGR